MGFPVRQGSPPPPPRGRPRPWGTRLTSGRRPKSQRSPKRKGFNGLAFYHFLELLIIHPPLIVYIFLVNACTLYIRFQRNRANATYKKKVSSHKKLQTKVQKNSFLLIVYRIIERGFNLLYYNQIGLCAAIVFTYFSGLCHLQLQMFSPKVLCVYTSKLLSLCFESTI